MHACSNSTWKQKGDLQKTVHNYFREHCSDLQINNIVDTCTAKRVQKISVSASSFANALVLPFKRIEDLRVAIEKDQKQWLRLC